MTTSSFYRHALALVAAIVLFGAAVPGFQNPSDSHKTVTPGSIALLVNKLDAAGLKQLRTAIDDNDALVRTVAARSVAAVGYGPFGDALLQAFEREQNEDAAIEQARALLYIRAGAAAEPIAWKMRAVRGLASLLAEWMVRTQPDKLADELPKWAAVLGDRRAALEQPTRAVLNKAPASSERVLRFWLESSNAAEWSAFLWSLACDGSPAQTVVLTQAMKSNDAAVREETVWRLVSCVSSDEKVPAALLGRCRAR
jgi:hypothetical protein